LEKIFIPGHVVVQISHGLVFGLGDWMLLQINYELKDALTRLLFSIMSRYNI
jgi:hypothetical protein